MNDDLRVDQITDPDSREAVAAARMNGLLEHFDGSPLTFPAETGDVLQSMQVLGYRLDGDWLLALLNQGTLAVAVQNGKRRWSAWDCWTLTAVLESRRRFTLHPAHAHKLSALELQQLQAEAAGQVSAFHDLNQFDVEQLLLFIEGAETHALRHCLRIAIQTKLRNGESL